MIPTNHIADVITTSNIWHKINYQIHINYHFPTSYNTSIDQFHTRPKNVAVFN